MELKLHTHVDMLYHVSKHLHHYMCCNMQNESEVICDMLIVSQVLFHLKICKCQCYNQAFVASTLLMLQKSNKHEQ